MKHCRSYFLILLTTGFIFIQCRNNSDRIPEKHIVVNPVKLVESTAEDIHHTLEFLKAHQSKLNDTVDISFTSLIDSLYSANQYLPIWLRGNSTIPEGNSFINLIQNSRLWGLFPNDYHYYMLAFIDRAFTLDTNAARNAALWARKDLLLTDAFFLMAKHLKQGRIPYDSVTLRTDTVLTDSFYSGVLNQALQSGNVSQILHNLEPRWKGYDSLKAYIGAFLDSASFAPYTYLPYPYTDSVSFFHLLQKRLVETGNLSDTVPPMSSGKFRSAIIRFQKKYEYKVTGYTSNSLVDRLNNTDLEKFKRIAVTLDRYKQLPDSLPLTYVWVNLPGYNLRVIDHDTVVFASKIIVGGPLTRSPVLTGEISNFITMPQWTVPFSIIFKEMLPNIIKDSNFLKKENLMVVDDNDSVLDPHTINWKRLNKKNFPYQIKQREGDDNSLGVIKFNFRNKYSVYLHDTNVRWRFGNSYRAISHGCVRVKEWDKLANYLVRNDSLRIPPDTIKAYIARGEKHMFSGFHKLPLYIRYYTCEGKNGKIVFYEDIYDEDRTLIQKYFANKSVF
ncbi:MAG TPA: L,D-transpeptidase family protein [Puia sp.]|jgi:murein L,D-transpeptidase YcbB/YkuD|nr:L,D-transpeptidase family protein [Puia sp.]